MATIVLVALVRIDRCRSQHKIVCFMTKYMVLVTFDILRQLARLYEQKTAKSVYPAATSWRVLYRSATKVRVCHGEPHRGSSLHTKKVHHRLLLR